MAMAHPQCPEHSRVDERTATIKRDLDIAFDTIRKNQELVERTRQKDREDTQHAVEAVYSTMATARAEREAQRANDLKDIATSMKALSDSIHAIQQNNVRTAVILSGVLFIAALLANHYFKVILP